MRGTRWILLVAIAAIVTGLGLTYRAQKRVLRDQSPPRPAALPDDLNSTAQHWSYSETNSNHTTFEITAEDFREVKDSDPVREKYPLLFLTARAPGHSEGMLPKRIFLDLVEANRQQLLAAGVMKKNIEASPLCTNCHPELLFSHRAERGKTGRMMGVVGIRG